jgi:hypothetical protein
MTLNWAGPWSSTNTYNVGDAVSYLGSSYIAVTGNTNVIPSSDENTWNLLAAAGEVGPQGATGLNGISGTGIPQGLYWRGNYSTLTSYNAYDCVAYNNSSYICTANGTLNKEPDNNPAYWGVLCVGNGQSGGVAVLWGGIVGTLSNQTDLQSALNAKVNTSSLATVATSGSYSDLSNKPTIPAAQVNSDWNASSGVAQILNKPSIPSAVTFKVNGTNAGSQTTVNLAAGSNVTVTDNGTGTITIASTASGGGGGTTYNVVAKSTNYTASNGDIVLCTTTTAGFTVTLPTPTVDSLISVKKVSSDAHVVTVSPSSGQVEGASTMTITTQGDCADFAADGTNWWLI